MLDEINLLLLRHYCQIFKQAKGFALQQQEFQANHPLAWKCKFNLMIARFQFARFRCCIYLHVFVNRIPDFAKWNFPDASQK